LSQVRSGFDKPLESMGNHIRIVHLAAELQQTTNCVSNCGISAIYPTLEEGGIEYLPMQLYPRSVEIIAGMRVPIP
jgi:hypothetical protein